MISGLRVTERLPAPLTMVGVVTHDVAARTLVVRRQEQASGFERLAWREAYNALVRAEQNGWPFNGAPHLYADGGGGVSYRFRGARTRSDVTFCFQVPSEAYAELVSRAGLTSWVTADRSTGWFQSVRFRHRP
jgi:hypothetical protein